MQLTLPSALAQLTMPGENATQATGIYRTEIINSLFSSNKEAQ